MHVSNYYARKETREKYEARVKAIKDKYKKLQEEEIEALGGCEFSEEDIEQYRQEVIAKYGVGKIEEDGLSLQITEQAGWEVRDEDLAIKSLIAYYTTRNLRNALDALTISKSNLNKFANWLEPLQETISGVDYKTIYKVTVKEVK